MVLNSICLLPIFTTENAEASASPELFDKYPNKYFVESGTYVGTGLEMALAAGYEKLYSIELDPGLCENAQALFSQFPQVKIIHGDSGAVLPSLLQEIDAPATFWLDGHYSGDGTAKGDTHSPILKELEAIKLHPIKSHTILIDDIRDLGSIHFDYVTLGQLIKVLLTINPEYTIRLEDGHFKNDVLVAVIDTD